MSQPSRFVATVAGLAASIVLLATDASAQSKAAVGGWSR
jgi:hypothetical protein